MLRFFRRERTKTIVPTSLGASIVGDGFARYALPAPVHIPRGAFLFVKVKGEEHELLVKARHLSNQPSDVMIENYRPASREEVKQLMRNIVKGILWEHKYEDLKIVKAELDVNIGHIVFYYTAERRYTLNRLAARLAKILHVKVEFKQIGSRDFAREIGGIGLCGREICCRTFLKEIPTVTLDMARQQYLFAVPEKLSGLCGRLLCCLRFELPYYERVSKYLPKVGSVIETEKGKGRVVEVNAILQTYKLRYEDDTEEKVFVELPEVERDEGNV